MAHITTNGTTTVTSEVRGAEGLENTITKMRLFVKDIYTTEKFGLSADDLIQRQYAVITNLNDKKDFDEFSSIWLTIGKLSGLGINACATNLCANTCFWLPLTTKWYLIYPKEL